MAAGYVNQMEKARNIFHIKEKVNCGVVNFIRDYINIYKGVLAVNSEEYIKLMHDRKESLEDNPVLQYAKWYV